MNVVSVMAHQDDEMRCLGTMLKCRDRGDCLFFITLTDGSGGFVHMPSISREQAAAIRHREMAAMAEQCGAEYINLRELDEFLYDTPDVRLSLIEAIRRSKADLIFTHYQDDYNIDHTTVNSLVRQCAMLSCLPTIATDSAPLKTHPAVFMAEPHGTIDFPATHYVDISEYFETKAKLLQNHVSQEQALRKALGNGLQELISIPDAFHGQRVGCKYAECFCAMPSRGSIKPYNVLP